MKHFVMFLKAEHASDFNIVKIDLWTKVFRKR